MQKKIIEFNQAQKTKQFPDFKAGDVVKVHRKIKEGEKERIQLFEGIVIAVKGGQSASPTITVRKVSEGVGVELILPIHSSGIEKIELVKKARVRQAKLYYLRGLTAKKSRMKYKDVAEFIPEKITANIAPAETGELAAKKEESEKEA